MTTDIQIASNRENARGSSGPRTSEGKAIVARNGLTHGLTGRFQLLDGESPEILDNLLARLTAEHRPAGEAESFPVRQLAVYSESDLKECDNILKVQEAFACGKAS